MLRDESIDASINDLARRMFRCFTAPPDMTVDEWADKYRQLPKVSNAKGGRWRSRCYQREIMRETTNPHVRSVVFVAAAQTGGKSEIILNFIGRQSHLNPGPMMLVQPTNELAERFSKKRVQPTVRETPILRDLWEEQKSRAGSNTIRQKQFPGGALNIAGANTPNELCSDPIRDILIDEVDRCEAAAGNEGDIVTLSEARQESFGEDAFSLFTSTPSGKKPRPLGDDQPKGVSKIMLLFAESDQRYWFCPCQKCGHMQTLRWEQVDFSNKGTREDPRYVCESKACEHPHTDGERVAMIEAGEWRATAPFTGRRGYFLNGIYSLSKAQRGCNSKMHQMVRDFLRAKRRGVEALKAWVNTFLCECFADEETDEIDGDPLFKRREVFGDKLPEKCCFITAGIDVHPDRIEAQIVGWGEGEESWPLEYDVFLGKTDKKEQGPWLELDKFLLKTFDHPYGVAIGVERSGLDTGHSTDQAYEFARIRALRGVHAIKGITGIGLPVANLPRKSGVKKVRLWLIAKHSAMRTLYTRLATNEPGPGYIHFRSDREPHFGQEYFKQLTAAEVRTEKKNGVYVKIFDPGTRRDEASDTWCYALGALRIRDVNYPKLLRRLKEQGEAMQGERPAEEPKPKRKIKQPSRGFISRW